jgi:uncharacterized membrane protein
MAGRATAEGGMRTRVLDGGPLAVLVVFSLVAVAGYGIFGQNPGRLGTLSPAAARFYGVSFGFFAQAQVVLAALVLGIHLVRRAGWRWLGAFGVVYGVSLGSELMGTAFGVPFGPYAYTDLLGVKWLGLVPVLIPLSWFFMAVPSYGLASWALGRGGREGGPFSRILLGSLLLLSWDLSLDPAMSEVTRYWVWGERGPYYGMPLMNLAGWYLTGVVLMAVLESFDGRRWLSDLTPGWQASYYAANLVLPLGMCLVAGLWGAAVATAMVLGGVVVWASLRSRTPSSGAVAGAGLRRSGGGVGRASGEAPSGAEVVR